MPTPAAIMPVKNSLPITVITQMTSSIGASLPRPPRNAVGSIHLASDAPRSVQRKLDPGSKLNSKCCRLASHVTTFGVFPARTGRSSCLPCSPVAGLGGVGTSGSGRSASVTQWRARAACPQASRFGSKREVRDCCLENRAAATDRDNRTAATMYSIRVRGLR